MDSALNIILAIGILAMGADRAYFPDSYSTTLLWNGFMLFGGLFGAMAGGCLCRIIAKRPGPVLFTALVIVAFTMSSALAETIERPRGDETAIASETAVRPADEPFYTSAVKSKLPLWVMWGHVVISGLGILVGGGRQMNPTVEKE